MSKKTGFDNQLYLKEQTRAIYDRLARFSGKLYLEFGGKLLYDMHAARVLPGFDPNVKIKLLQKIKNQTDVITCIYAGDIERKKIRADFGITYDADALKMIDDLREWGIHLSAVVITRYEDQAAARVFKNKLERRNIPVYTHAYTKGYPTDIDLIVSDEGYGANQYIKTEKPIVVVTGPGPGSGKLATCLSQMYHDYKRGIRAGYAKFETFPIWNLSINHEVNAAYEAATADIKDVNVIDYFHLDAYNEKTVNYNRDVDAFPLLKRILEKISGHQLPYHSPTDMGVNRVGFGIIDDQVVRQAAIQEIIRRYFRYACEYSMGLADKDTVQRLELLMENLKVNVLDRKVVKPAREAAIEAQHSKEKGNNGVYCGAAIELPDGSIVTGKNSPLMHAASSLVLNAAKKLADIPDQIHLLSPSIIQSLSHLKQEILQGKKVSLNLDETLIALSIGTTTSPVAQVALEMLKKLRNCEVHLTHMPTPGDEAGLKKLGVNLTSDPSFSSKNLFIE